MCTFMVTYRIVDQFGRILSCKDIGERTLRVKFSGVFLYADGEYLPYGSQRDRVGSFFYPVAMRMIQQAVKLSGEELPCGWVAQIVQTRR